MTLRLILTRHAKSSWSDPFADDHARELNARGRASAAAIGGWLKGRDYIPETVLCSDATRTHETAKLIFDALGTKPKLRLMPSLYHAAPDTLMDSIHRETANVIALIGHNPGIGMFANGLVANAPDHARFSGYPTCATTVIDFHAESWSAVQRHTGTCVDFIVPRDLIGTTGGTDH
ncbi:SixA phosphatase family protein [Loktanella sp. S4079]|uniref:SixA phosphatase family protein n=1 Tax=Loktanella sp. S4079 TaxID=579483 RepID=UPI0005FA2017|nr:histidine phosphatase family protein [Loktanella sp. S4079]KJZ19058.1 phosphoglycerate mutase [Loktanella sp. S4079]